MLSGEVGVGKSRLARELLARHAEACGMFARAHPLGVTPNDLSRLLRWPQSGAVAGPIYAGLIGAITMFFKRTLAFHTRIRISFPLPRSISP